MYVTRTHLISLQASGRAAEMGWDGILRGCQRHCQQLKPCITCVQSSSLSVNRVGHISLCRPAGSGTCTGGLSFHWTMKTSRTRSDGSCCDVNERVSCSLHTTGLANLQTSFHRQLRLSSSAPVHCGYRSVASYGVYSTVSDGVSSSCSTQELGSGFSTAN